MKMITFTLSFLLVASTSVNAQPVSSQILTQTARKITQVKAPMGPAPSIKYGSKNTDLHRFSQIHNMNLAMLGLVKRKNNIQLQQSDQECQGSTYKNQSHCKLRGFK